MPDQFAVGEVVLLRSGGRIKMTVSEKLDDGRIRCRWDSGRDIKRDDFDPAELVRYVPSRPVPVTYPTVSKGL